jgi:uncharacterized membrane protein
MTSYHYLIIARIVHVVGVVLWIGGVAFVTTVLIPALRRMPDTEKRFELFEQLERRFAWQARIVTLLTGLSGLYMLHAYEAWARYSSPVYWWMHLMTFVWLVFTLVLFVFEPAFLHRWFKEQAAKDSENAFRWLNRMHVILLTISLIAVIGAIAGARGWNMFS